MGGDTENIYKIILDNLPSGVIFCDKECKIVFINRIYADYLGVDRNEVFQKPITDYIPESRLGIVLETGRPELGFRCSVGEGKEKKILIVNRIPTKGADGDIIGVISQSIFGDIGELKDLSDRLSVLEKKVDSYKEKIRSAFSVKYTALDIKGQSPGILEAKELLTKYAKSYSPVLLLGATGTGKELFAHALHSESGRSRGPFVSINCAAIPHDLLESELFGYVHGAFTGAQKNGKLGRIELADKGTLFFDEIGDMPLSAQVKLLRVLEEKCVYRLGTNHPQNVEFRLIAATSKDLRTMMRNGKFREELYFRLNAMIVAIPPLCERKEDIPLLTRHFLDGSDRRGVAWTDEAMSALMGYSWPGNVRELQNAVERAVSLCKGYVFDVEDIPAEVVVESAPPLGVAGKTEGSPISTLVDNERTLITAVLVENDWNVRKTAKMLGICRATLYKRIKEYQLSRSS